MNRKLLLQGQAVRLRSIDEGDLEDLRRWKNANKQAFFFKGEISPEDQKRWYQGYLKRPEDFMFVVESRDGTRAGCMGFRLQEGEADCYNIIGAPEGTGKGWLGEAMKLMVAHIKKEHPGRAARCKVIKTNPAVGWYQKQGFRIVGEGPDYVRLEHA